MRHAAKILIAAAVLALPSAFYARPPHGMTQPPEQEDRDSLVRLISADSLQLMDVNGESCRRVVGRPARFFHNNTYLLCDTAIWNVDREIINALGNVKIIQDRTELRSDRLDYYVDRDLAEFRGDLVILTDKDNNTLKTRYLDYNTKDSIAVFRNGASMRDKDGQIIESMSGNYDSKIKTFVFSEDVNMYTDSVFVKTTWLKYESDLSLATFGYNTHAWKENDMLSANAGNYDRSCEKFFFHKNVHVMTDTQEGWCDSLYFDRATLDVTMLGNAQVTDTTRAVYALGGRFDYVDSLSQVTMTRSPAVVAEVDDEQSVTGKDSVWFGGEMLRYWTVRMCDIDSLERVSADERLKSVETDPVAALRKQAAEAAAKAAEEAEENDPNSAKAAARRQEEYNKSRANGQKGSSTKKNVIEKPARVSFRKEAPDSSAMSPVDTSAVAPPADSPDMPVSADSLEIVPPADSLDTIPPADSLSGIHTPPDTPAEVLPDIPDAPSDTTALSNPADTSDVTAAADSLAAPVDTTKIGFLSARGKVRIFRKSMQVLCDSLDYCDLDSIARLYKSPKIWNEEGRHQYNADSVYAVIRNNSMEKANLLSDAFIHIQEDTLHYDQIRSAEMTAYFAGGGKLSRFDALGGALALFYIEENDELATVNKKDAKMLSAVFKDGAIQRIYYFQEVKSDAYPVVQMTDEDKIIKGFAWTPDERPKSRYDITPLGFHRPERNRYEAVPHAKFIQTDIYFPGYIEDVHRQLEIRDSLKAVRARQREREKALAEEAARQAADSLARVNAIDSLSRLDSLARVNAADSLGMIVPSDSLGVAGSPADSASVTGTPAMGPKEQARLEKKAAREEAARRREEAARKREEAADARFERRETKAAIRQAHKDALKEEKLRKRKIKALMQAEKEKAREEVLMQKYMDRLGKAKARKPKSSRASKSSAETVSGQNSAVLGE